MSLSQLKDKISTSWSTNNQRVSLIDALTRLSKNVHIRSVLWFWESGVAWENATLHFTSTERRNWDTNISLARMNICKFFSSLFHYTKFLNLVHRRALLLKSLYRVREAEQAVLQKRGPDRLPRSAPQLWLWFASPSVPIAASDWLHTSVKRSSIFNLIHILWHNWRSVTPISALCQES